jgi:hypothetical protein
MPDLNRAVREEMRVRQELLKKDRQLVLLIDEQSRRKGENYLASLIQNGAIRLNTDGSLRVAPERVKPPPPIRRLAPIRPKLPPSDYPRLLQANRQRTWATSPESFRVYRDLLQCVQRANKPLTALHAATLAALELNIPIPNVRVWRGDERQAENKLGWACPDNPGEINVILGQSCRQIITTAVHETRHCYQFLNFPNLTGEQLEADAAEFEKEFAVFVLHEAKW